MLRAVRTAGRLAVACAVAAGAAAAGAVHPVTAAAQGPTGSQVRAAEMPQLQQTDVPAAWPVTKGAGVTVAVLDTGVDASVPDLTGSVTTGPDYTAGANPPGYQPPHLHGTYISSLIAGHGSGPGDAGGVIGVAPAAKILAVRVILDDDEPGFDVYNQNASYADAIDQGIRYAVGHGATVINMSLGDQMSTRDMRLAIGYAVAHNVVVVASAGNDGSSDESGYTPYSYPASFTGVISVAAVDSSGARASFSDRNASVVISAPGVGVIGAGPGGEYLDADGTSPAAAFVSGVAALIRSKYPGLTAALVTQALVSSTQHRPTGGYNPDVGAGEVDAAAALKAAATLAAQRPRPGLSASAHFASPPGPVQVVHRDYQQIIALALITVVAAAGFCLMVVLALVWLRRDRSARRGPGASADAGPAPASEI